MMLVEQGQVQFLDNNGDPLAGGRVFFYIPNTQTPKDTYTDPSGGWTNPNPVVLNSAGRAVIWGNGLYRQVVQNVNGETVWDQIVGNDLEGDILGQLGPLATAQMGPGLQLYGGAPGAVRVNFPTIQDSTPINMTANPQLYHLTYRVAVLPVAYTLPSAASVWSGFGFWVDADGGSCTFFPQGTDHFYGRANGAPWGILQRTTAYVTSNGIDTWYITETRTPQIPNPGGYLSLVNGNSGRLVPVTDITSSIVYYLTRTSEFVPIITGEGILPFAFPSGLSLQLTNDHIAGNIYDVFVTLQPGGVTLVTGPSWAAGVVPGNITPGACARGLGAGSTQLSRLAGILVNTNPMGGRNGGNVYSIAGAEGTYLGSILIGGVNGAVSCTPEPGQSRVWGVFNAYNQQLIVLQTVDPTSSWNYSTAVVRPSNDDPNNKATVLQGVEQGPVVASFTQRIEVAGTNVTTVAAHIGIGNNKVTGIDGTWGMVYAGGGGASTLGSSGNAEARNILPTTLGVNVFQCVELPATPIADTPAYTYFGTVAGMVMTAQFMA